MSTPVPVPEGDVTKRTLHFFWLADYSGSMQGKKIATLNQAIREALPEVRKAVAAHPEVQVMMRAIKFADEAAWHVGPAPVPLDQFVWPELDTGGQTATAQAIRLLASELTLEKMPRRALPPVCLLLSDGHHTDPQEDYDGAIAELLKLPWGLKAVRLAIGIAANEADYDEDELLKFVSHKEVGVLKAHTPQELLRYIRWASVTATVGASRSKGKGGAGAGATNVALPAPPPAPAITSSTDEF
jgi:uncharacterized protein YegL